LLCGILCLLCAIGQEQLPFHVGNQQVDSDDTLYFGDTLFHKDLADITTMVVNMLVTLLDQAADKVQGAYQALDVCNAFLTTFNVHYFCPKVLSLFDFTVMSAKIVVCCTSLGTCSMDG
jgi:hypothetical protein